MPAAGSRRKSTSAAAVQTLERGAPIPPRRYGERPRVLLAMEWLDYELNLGIASFARKARWVVDDVISHTGKPSGNWRGDGIIALLRNRGSELVQFVASHDVPVVDLVAELPDIAAVRVLADNVGIGRAAAEHLLSCGLRHFAFLNLWNSRVEQERMRGFRETIEQAGHQFVPLNYYEYDRGAGDVEAIFDWLPKALADLPKPLGIMGQHDREAIYILQACELANLRVPEQVAVVGSDNDPLLCELGPVPLSSVDNRRRDQGYEAARMLSQLMKGEAPPKQSIRVRCGPVIVRHSSEMLAVPDEHLSNALRYIAAHYRQPIGVDEVVDHAGSTRRRLYMLFEEHLGRGIHAEILRRRLDLARRLLLTTTDKLYAIARACGFQDAQQLTRVFTREVGISPSRYRQQQGRETSKAE